MKNPEDKIFIQTLINRAEENEHTKFAFIRSYLDYKLMKVCLKSIKNVIANFTKSSNNIFKDYLSGISINKDRPDLLLSYLQIKEYINFYKKEELIIKDMLAEYKCYLSYGHRIQSILFNKPRPEEDLTDWRKLPLGW